MIALKAVFVAFFLFFFSACEHGQESLANALPEGEAELAKSLVEEQKRKEELESQSPEAKEAWHSYQSAKQRAQGASLHKSSDPSSYQRALRDQREAHREYSEQLRKDHKEYTEQALKDQATKEHAAKEHATGSEHLGSEHSGSEHLGD